MSTGFDARAELMNVAAQLVDTGRFKQTKCATAVAQFTQDQKSWNCIGCGKDGESAAHAYYNGESNRLSVGVRSKATPHVTFSSTFCTTCITNYKSQHFKTDELIFQLLSTYLAEHYYYVQYGVGRNWPPPSPLRKSRATAANTARPGKARGRPRGSKRSGGASFSFVDDGSYSRSAGVSYAESSYSAAEPGPAEAIFNEAPISIQIADDLGVANGFYFPPHLLAEPSNSSTLNVSAEQPSYGVNYSPIFVPVSFPRLLPEKTDGLVEQEFNFEFYQHFDSAYGKALKSTASSGKSPIDPVKFLLFNGNLSQEEARGLISVWVNFVMFFLHQCKDRASYPLKLTGDAAFFEKEKIPTFTAQSLCNSDYSESVLKFAGALRDQALQAGREEKLLKRWVDSNFPGTVQFSKLVRSLIGPNYALRQESELFARYFFRFPDRIKGIYQIDGYQLIANLTQQDIGNYKSGRKLSIPDCYISTTKS